MELAPTLRYLFLFAHYDDDVFIAGTMKLLLDQGADLHAAWVTDGDYFGQEATRLRELERAMSILGLDESRRHRLGFPDLGLVERLPEAAVTVTDLISGLRPDRIFATAFEGGHPDHDSVNFLAAEGSRRAGISPELLEFPLYNAAGRLIHGRWRINSFPTDDPPPVSNPLTADALRCKHRMMRSYPSQWMYMTPARLASAWAQIWGLGEPYRVCPPSRDHTRPPHEGRLSYERWFNRWMGISFTDFRAAVERVQTSRT